MPSVKTPFLKGLLKTVTSKSTDMVQSALLMFQNGAYEFNLTD